MIRIVDCFNGSTSSSVCAGSRERNIPSVGGISQHVDGHSAQAFPISIKLKIYQRLISALSGSNILTELSRHFSLLTCTYVNMIRFRLTFLSRILQLSPGIPPFDGNLKNLNGFGKRTGLSESHLLTVSSSSHMIRGRLKLYLKVVEPPSTIPGNLTGPPRGRK